MTELLIITKMIELTMTTMMGGVDDNDSDSGINESSNYSDSENGSESVNYSGNESSNYSDSQKGRRY
jgi:hypothetical protein